MVTEPKVMEICCMIDDFCKEFHIKLLNPLFFRPSSVLLSPL